MTKTTRIPSGLAKGLLATAAIVGVGFGAAGAAQAASCDRACLIKLTDTYLAALAKHDPKGLPIAANVKFVENVKRLKVGEGLWSTTTAAPTTFSVHVPDPVNQTAGWLGMLKNKGEPTIVAIRLKLKDGKIVEAEHLTAAIRPAQMVNLSGPRVGLINVVPPAGRKSHDELIKIGASYYPALDDNDGTLMPFAADCERHENGMVTAGPGPSVGAGPNGAGSAPIARDCAGQLSSNVMAYITRIDNRRVFAADPVTGLVMGFSHFRHPMDFAPYPVKAIDGTVTMYDTKRMNFKPFDLPAAHVFKVGADGKVHEIEAMGFQAPLNAPTGWED
jgi:hypothetical protein